MILEKVGKIMVLRKWWLDMPELSKIFNQMEE